jgi:hypothetical protein
MSSSRRCSGLSSALLSALLSALRIRVEVIFERLHDFSGTAVCRN